MSNSDVPGPYRQDSAGDYDGAVYGGADYRVSRSAGHGGGGHGAPGGRRDAGGDRADYGRDSGGRRGGEYDRGGYRDGDSRGSSRGDRGYGDQGYGDQGSGSGGRRRRTEPPGADRGGSWASAARPDVARDGGRADSWRSRTDSWRSRTDSWRSNADGVAQGLRDRLGVAGARGGRGQRGAGGQAPGGYERYGDGHDGRGGYPGGGRGRSDYAGQGQGGRPPGGYPAGGTRTGGYRANGRGTGGYPAGGRGGGGYGGGSGGGGNGRGIPPGGRGQRRTLSEWFKSGDWWRRWTWKKAIGLALVLTVGPTLLFMAFLFLEYERTPIPTDASALATAAPSDIYYRNGQLMSTISSSGLNRQILTSDQIPQVMDDAIIAAEDRHFYTEGGISITGIMRAAFEDIKGGSASQGGSTLTEQFVKNYYSGFASNSNSDKNASDKFRQALVAVKLAHSKSKSWILTEYLNTVYLGQSAYGVGAAAQVYFGEPAAKLTPSQAAVIAALANLPGYFSTDPHAGDAYTALVGRWQYVLGNMVRDNALTAAQRQQILKAGFPSVHLQFPSELDGQKGYLAQMVEQELSKTYGITQAQLSTGGLKIYTTFSQQDEGTLTASVNHDKRYMAELGRPLFSYAHIGAVLEDPVTGAIEAVYGGPGYGLPEAECEKVFCQLNMAEDPKQVGSSFKPYVLATAVSQGMNVQSSILNGNSPLWIPEGSSMAERQVLSSPAKPVNPTQSYLQFNEKSENSGAVSPQKAAAISSDPAFEDLAHRVGVQNVIDMTKDFGVGETPFFNGRQSDNDWVTLNAQFGSSCPKGGCSDTNGSVAIALGEGELTAVEQASMFATLADGGMYHTPHVISRIVQGNAPVPLKIQVRQVLTPAAAADVDFALSADNVPGGTAYPNAAWPGYQVIGKTGTTQTAQDAWFIGAIPQQALAVTLFTNQQDSNTAPGAETLDNLVAPPGSGTGAGFGGAWPAYIWHTFMTAAFGGLQAQPLPAPDYTGFSIWNQVGNMPPPQQPTHKHHHPGFPAPTLSPCDQVPLGTPCNPVGGFSPPAGGGGGNPNPNPSPSATATCVPTVINPCTGQVSRTG